MVHRESDACGIVFTDDSDRTAQYLPLEQASAHAEIVDVSAIVTLTQVFWQYARTNINRAKYVFPVPARAAVCGFEMRTQDGRVLKAVSKEKDEAKREHLTAMRQGRMTGLVEHVTDDLFTISLGALPSEQMVTTTLTYVMDLMDADLTDQVRFQLPCCVGQRYGHLPTGMAHASTFASERVKVTASIQTKGIVRSVQSPTHTIRTYGSDGAPTYTESVQAGAEYLSSSFLSQDFVLVIKADGLDVPRCFAERHSDGSIAIQLTLVPKFDLSPIATQEYIFIVDRSGSMNGSRIETARKALVMLLRALPVHNTTFNILSFGNNCDGIWKKSLPYSESSLLAATQHVDRMRADYGGTELRKALKFAFKSRNTSIPTACFLLTDGEAYDVENTLDLVTKAVSKAKSKAPLRVFTLGIGETTSTAMCEGIARVGNGICLMAATSESIIGKCSKLVRASRTYILKNVSIDWGHARQHIQALRQAPENITALYSGARFVVFALIRPPTEGSSNHGGQLDVPKEIVLKAQRDGRGDVLKFAFPVQELTRAPASRQLIHILAARRIIQELTDGEQRETFATAKTTIIQLGTQYQLASKYTSFIAVDQSGEQVKLPEYDDSEVMQSVGKQGQTKGQTTQDRLAHMRLSHPGPGAVSSSSSMVQAAVVPDSDEDEWDEAAIPRGLSDGLVLRRGISPTERDSAGALSDSDDSANSPHRNGPVSRGSMPHIERGPVGALHAEEDEEDRDDSMRPRGLSSPVVPSSALYYNPSTPASSPPPVFAPQAALPSAHHAPTDASVLPASYATKKYRRSTLASPISSSSAGPVMSWFRSRKPQPQLASIATSSLCSSAPQPVISPQQSVTESYSGINDGSSPRQESDVVDLVRLQSFNGSFPPGQKLERFVGSAALAQAGKIGVPAIVWATMLAVAYLKKRLNEPELLEGLVEKAKDFVAQTPGADFDSLLEKAEALIV